LWRKGYEELLLASEKTIATIVGVADISGKEEKLFGR
jgi:hypothetical protein